MDPPGIKELEKLPKETLIEVIKMYSRNWQTLDGLWFTGVEEKFGLDAAVELDVRMWRIGSKIEAKRIKELFNLKGGLKDVLRAIDLMTWAGGFGYEYDINHNKAIWTCRHCPPQEQRIKLGKGEFPCRPTFEACFNNVIQVIDPSVKVECIFCPPGSHPNDAWCQWQFSIPET
jgi:hypothetical protein